MKTGNKVDNTRTSTRQLGFASRRFGCLVGRTRDAAGVAILGGIVETVHRARRAVEMQGVRGHNAPQERKRERPQMKHLLWLTAMAFVLVCAAGAMGVAGVSDFAFAQKESDAAKITALENKWAASYKSRDVEGMSSLLADDFIITIEDGRTFSKLGYISHCNDKTTKVDVAEFIDLKVRIRGNTAIVTGGYHESGATNGKPYEYHDRLTDVWMLIGGRWQVVASHYSIPAKEGI
jgi:ketosteroid isomerase-like protein